MAATTRYHILPEEARPSMDELPPSALEDERLLGPDSEVSSHHTPEPSSGKERILTFHPSVILRLFSIALLATSLGLFCGSSYRQAGDVAAIVFLSIALLRHLLVIGMHVIGHWVSFQVEIVRRDGTSRVLQGSREGRVCKKGKRCFERYGMQILIEGVILVGMIPTASVGYGHGNIAASIVFWTALPFHIISALDLGNPRKFPVRGKIVLRGSGCVEEGTIALPENGWDGDAPVLSQKTVADAPIYA